MIPHLRKLFFISLLVATGCGKSNDSTDSFDISKSTTPQSMLKSDRASVRVDMKSVGVGPIREVALNEGIDEQMVAEGKLLFYQKCTVCHKEADTFIGPSPKGITKRRSPEWIMNMILNPEGMIKEDQLAKDLFMEFNGTPMANQGLTEEEARSVLEYFRTLN